MGGMVRRECVMETGVIWNILASLILGYLESLDQGDL